MRKTPRYRRHGRVGSDGRGLQSFRHRSLQPVQVDEEMIRCSACVCSTPRKNCIERIEREMIRRGQIKGGELAGIYVTKHNHSQVP